MLVREAEIGQTPEDNGYNVTVRREHLFPLGELVFEGRAYPAPGNPEAYLRTIYGDYQVLPPPEKRVTHVKRVVINDGVN